MYTLQYLGPDDCMQIGLHEVKHQVDIFVVIGPDEVL
jgi:hypothetical protein